MLNNLHKDSYGGKDATVEKYAVVIPQSSENYKKFVEGIKKEEEKVKVFV